MKTRIFPSIGFLLGILVATNPALGQDEPPALNPFAPKPTIREDAIPGYLELSDQTIHLGKVHLTRDTRLKIYDGVQKRQREVPLRVILKIECKIEKEWIEKIWRFKENANAEKYYTGETYPAREFIHVITLQDGRTIEGPIDGILYVHKEDAPKPDRFLIHKRQKGPIGSQLEDLIFLRSVHLGDKAMAEGKRLQEEHIKQSERSTTERSTRK